MRKMEQRTLVWLSRQEVQQLMRIIEFGQDGGVADLHLNWYMNNQLVPSLTMRTVIGNLERWGLIERHPNATADIYRATQMGSDYFRPGPGE